MQANVHANELQNASFVWNILAAKTEKKTQKMGKNYASAYNFIWSTF